MDKMMGNMSPEKKMDMMKKMMPKMMEDISQEDMSGMMGEMMPAMMEKMDPKQMMEKMHVMMPKMMEHCLGGMEREDREKMLNFCDSTIRQMRERFM